MDLSHAVRKFEEYLDHYDRDDDKIRLKITHTYGVVEYSRKIALRLGLPEEDVELAQIIGLLHDIGRFEQIKRFDSFEPATMDHAEFGVRILFEEGMIRQFLEKGDWDQIIETAVARHSDFRLEGIQDARALLHAKIIRDADKLDNCRVKLDDSIEVMLGCSAGEAGSQYISPEVWEECKSRKSVHLEKRKTKMDYWVSYIAYFFDINYPASAQIIQKERYVERIIGRIPYRNQETKERMQKLGEWAKEYLQKLAGGL